MRRLNIILIIAFAASVLSCNRDELFTREQYKNVVALLSEDGFNIFSEEQDLTKDETDGYIAASCGGSLPITQPIVLNMVEDGGLLSYYNNNSYADDASRYARYLSSSRYKIDANNITIPSGERTGRMKIRIKANGLSPDSVYFIPFRAKSFSAYELNPKKSTVMYRLYLKNFYATTKTATLYSHRGKRNGVNSMIQKQVFPVKGNEVRIMAGIATFEAKITTIAKWSIRLVIGDNGHITILPWNTSAYGLKVTQIDDDPDFPNVFKIVDDGYKTYKTFLLRYDYVDPDGGGKIQMQEELRLEYNPLKDK